MMSIESAKKKATALKNYLKQGAHSISHSSCLHAVAQMEGYKNWNTMEAVLENRKDPKERYVGGHAEISLPAILTIANKGSSGHLGELAIRVFFDVLARIEPNTSIVPFNAANLAKKLHAKEPDIDSSINELIDSKLFIRIIDDNFESHLAINIQQVWKGDINKHTEACHERMSQLAKETMNEATNPGYINPSRLWGKLPTISEDDSQVIELAKKWNSNKFSTKGKIVLNIEIESPLSKSSEFSALRTFIEQQDSPIADPRIYLKEVKKILGDQHYVGHGGNHIFINTRDDDQTIATIIIDK